MTPLSDTPAKAHSRDWLKREVIDLDLKLAIKEAEVERLKAELKLRIDYADKVRRLSQRVQDFESGLHCKLLREAVGLLESSIDPRFGNAFSTKDVARIWLSRPAVKELSDDK